MKISIDLPQEALDAIESRQDWTGQVKAVLSKEGSLFAPDTLRVSFPSVKRREMLGKAAKAAAGNPMDLSKTERLIVDAWNDSEFIRDYAAGESRNNPVPPREVPRLVPLLRRSIKEVGPEKLLGLMQQYFDCCLRQGHVWDDRNHGYSHLGGFLRAVVAWQRKGESAPYWAERAEASPVKDQHAPTTKVLADAYAKRFLGRAEFGLVNPSQDYSRFAAAAARVAAFRRKNPAWPEDRIIGHLLDAVAGAWGLGGSPPPGALASERTWSVTLPAALKSLYGGRRD